ncbi:MAG TPA: glycosyltransferase [Brumimicrobium sp.]|nr:glycosyltransferase [Brumimicrobium sp.]
MTSKKCHIAYLCASKSWGGLEMNQLRNAKWMSDRGHKVLMFVQENSKIHQEAVQNNLPVDFIKQHRKYYDLVNAVRLSRKLLKHQISHLIVRDPKDLSLCAMAKTWSKKKFFLAYFMEMQLGIPKRDLLHTLRYKKIDLWSCPLPWLQKQVVELTRFPKNRTTVIPSGLELDKYFNAISSQESKELLNLDSAKEYIGLVGRFDVQKGQLLLLEAFNNIKSKVQHNLVFLGESTHGESDAYLDELKNFVKTNNLQDRVFFRPFRKDVETFYSAIDVFVMATKAETFGMVTIEALASGCRVVGSNRGGTVEILNHGGFGTLFESEDVIDLGLKLLESINNVNFNPQLVIEESKRYDASKVCELVEEAIDCK